MILSEVRIYEGRPVRLTVDWTGRRISISAADEDFGDRLACVYRGLGSELWSISFSHGHAKAQQQISLELVTGDRETLVISAMRYVIVGDHPSQKDFETLHIIRAREMKLVSSLLGRIRRNGTRKLKGRGAKNTSENVT